MRRMSQAHTYACAAPEGTRLNPALQAVSALRGHVIGVQMTSQHPWAALQAVYP